MSPTSTNHGSLIVERDVSSIDAELVFDVHNDNTTPLRQQPQARRSIDPHHEHDHEHDHRLPTTPTTPTPPQPAPPTFPDGTLLINAQTGEIDQYSGAARHLISPPVAAKMGITSAQLTSVTADKFNLIPAGSGLLPRRDVPAECADR